MRFRCKQSMLQVVFIVAAAVPAVGWAQAEQTVRIGNAGPLTGAPRIGARTTRTAPGSPSKT